MKIRLSHTALCFFCSAVAQTYAATDTDTDTPARTQVPNGYREVMVVSGAYRERADFDLPFAIDRIDAAQIHDGQPGINLSEVLARVPGVVVQNRQNYAQDLQISMRGFGARAAFGVRGIKLVADNIPASTPDGQGQAATFNLDVADRIEVLRGPAATLYGSNAGGVLQMFSRDGVGAPRVAFNDAFGSDNLNKWRLTTEGAADDVGFVLDSSRLDTEGYRDHSATRRDQQFAKLNANPDADSRISLIYNALEQNETEDPLGQTWAGYRADPRSVVAGAILYNTRKSIDHQQLGANYERDFGVGIAQLNLYAGRRDVEQYLAIPKGVAANESGDGGVVDFERTFAGAGLRWLHSTLFMAGETHAVLGLDFNSTRDDRRGFQNYMGDALGVKGALRRDERDTVSSLEPYLQTDWTRRRWTIAGGLRHSSFRYRIDDFYLSNGDDGGSHTDTATTGSIGVSYAVTPQANAYFNIGRGYETPTLTEQAYAAGGSRGFNRSLQPAFSTQYEIGAKAAIDEAVRVNIAAFQIDTDDEIVVAASNGGRTSYQNAGATERRGFELGVDARFAKHWNVSFAYTYLSATYAEDFLASGRMIESGNRLPGVPATTAFAEVVWRPHVGLSTALEALCRDRVEVEDFNRAKAAPGYVALNWRATLEQQLGTWSLQQILRIDNLLDQRYIGSVIVNEANTRYYEAAPGRTWYAGISVGYRFE